MNAKAAGRPAPARGSTSLVLVEGAYHDRPDAPFQVDAWTFILPRGSFRVQVECR